MISNYNEFFNILDDATSGFKKMTKIESDVSKGVIVVPLSKYENYNTRICRPTGLSEIDKKRVVSYMIDSIGLDYDRKNVIDLIRYLLPEPPR